MLTRCVITVGALLVLCFGCAPAGIEWLESPVHAQNHRSAAAPATHPDQHEAEPAESADAVWSRLMEGNKRFVAGQPMSRSVGQIRDELATGQHPGAIVLGCSDSRVGPEIVFDQTIGDLFVVRTAGNVADPIALGSMEYAVAHMPISVIVVLGHTRCGAVTAAASGDRMPTVNLSALIRKINPALAPLRGKVSGDELVAQGVEANVRYSAKDVVARSPIIRKAVASGKVRVITAVYDLKTGEVTALASGK